MLTLALTRDVERVVVCTGGGDTYETPLREAGVPVEIVERPVGGLLSVLKCARQLARIIRRERPDVIHAHNPGASAAAAVARILARRPKVAIVTTYHGVLPHRIGTAFRVLARSADLVVGVGPYSTRALADAGFDASRLRTIVNAVDAQRTRSDEDVRREFGAEDCALVVTVGRHFPEKNQELYLEAVARLAGQGRRLRALLVGHGKLKDELRARITELGLDDVVTMTGRRADAPDLIGAADVFVLSSDSEGLPLVVLEAMSLGTPVVTTNAGGVTDAVADGETGVVVPMGDVDALAAGVARLLDDDALRARFARAGVEFIEEHCSHDAMVAAYRAAYVDALRARR